MIALNLKPAVQYQENEHPRNTEIELLTETAAETIMIRPASLKTLSVETARSGLRCPSTYSINVNRSVPVKIRFRQGELNEPVSNYQKTFDYMGRL